MALHLIPLLSNNCLDSVELSELDPDILPRLLHGLSRCNPQVHMRAMMQRGERS